MSRQQDPLNPATPARRPRLAAALALVGCVLATGAAAQATELAPALQKLATCEDSWYDTRRDEQHMAALGEALRGQFRPQDRSPVWKPIGRVSWLGAEVLEITPQSVGMALGFAVTLQQPMATVQPAFERALGQPMERCARSDGESSCERRIAEKRTVVMMAPLARPELGTLVGCYYFYER